MIILLLVQMYKDTTPFDGKVAIPLQGCGGPTKKKSFYQGTANY
jgi:hypothetical protein